MKKIILYTALVLLLYEAAFGQPLVIKGRVRCMNQSPNSSKGAENIIVVPTFMPSKSRMTASAPPGYFEVQTGMTMQQLQDKQVNVYLISKCNDCKESVKRIFISEDQDRQNRDNKVCYVTIKDWKMGKNCNEIELPPRRADSMLQVVMKQPGQTTKEITDATALVGSPALLNLLTTLATVLPVSNAGDFEAIAISEGKISYGNFLFASAMTHTSNTGFNFSPSRDLSEAAFWNPSTMVNSKKPNNVSLFTNIKNNVKLDGFFRLADKISFGVGGIYTQQDEFRPVVFEQVPRPSGNQQAVDSVLMKLKEYAVLVSSAYQVNKNFSLGLAVKSVWQDFNIPFKLNIQQGPDINTFTDSSINKQKFDVDFSLSYKVSKSFQVGINAMNLAGTKLYADAFLNGDPNPTFQNQRSFGLGLCYKWQRFNFGADILFTQDDFYDAAIGINYVPFNDALISAGIAFNQMSYSAAFRIKHFRIAYVNDNDYLVNEKRKGKSGILNGKIYGGFSFNF